MVGASSRAATPSNGLIGRWSLNETSGTIALDSSGGGRNGTLINGPIWSSGKSGNALTFDGVNDYVSIGDIDASPVSVGMWVKRTQNLTGWRSLVMKRST